MRTWAVLAISVSLIEMFPEKIILLLFYKLFIEVHFKVLNVQLKKNNFAHRKKKLRIINKKKKEK